MLKKLMQILIYPDPILSQISEAVQPKELLELKFFIDSMVHTMLMHNGIGLAAPQIGISKRIIVWRDATGDPEVFINPAIISSRGKVRNEILEGCLSVPNVQRRIQRRKRVITVDAIDENGNSVTKTLQNLPAVIVQHEIDHLDGITIVSKKSEVK